MKVRTFALAVAAGLVLPAVPAAAQTKLVIGTWAPPVHHINARLMPHLGKEIEKATGGRVTFEIKYNLAPPPGYFEAVRDGVADVSWIFHGYNPGKFVATQVMEMPGLGAGAAAGSAAYWRVHQKYLAKADEHKGVMVIGLMTHGAGVIQSQKPINSWADLKGLKVRLPGGIASKVGEAFGAVAVTVPAPKVYETLSSRVAEAVFMPWETHKSFRLVEVTKHVVEFPGNLYDGSFAIILNAAKFNSLSPDDRKAVMSVSGEKLSAFAGSTWADADEVGRQAAKAAGNTISTASPQMLGELKKVTVQIEEDWVKRASGKGYDPRAALNELRETARSLEKKK
ncbi:MAG: TRAP transporter substrate-binding protein [Burkholderiales bacterium]|nr:TRAP transporter substrate-binding protein [Burkholderiales bacterium]